MKTFFDKTVESISGKCCSSTKNGHNEAPKMDIMNMTDHQIDQDDDEDTVFVGLRFHGWPNLALDSQFRRETVLHL